MMNANDFEKNVSNLQKVRNLHTNPLKHKITGDFTSHKWSSWQSILSDAPTKIMRKEILDWFGGKDQFINVHRSA